MIVAHIGPGLARTGGPAGYLWQLRDAMAAVRTGHRVTFPDLSSPATPPPPPSLVARACRRLLRTFAGKPAFYRPAACDLHRRGGEMDAMLRSALAGMEAAAEPSLSRALDVKADVLFAHDVGAAALALRRRQRGQQVWLLLHSPMSFALYLAWNWGVPEYACDEVLRFPDVRFWTSYEVELCTQLDRLVLPCREAADDLVRCDAAFAPLLKAADVLPTAATRQARDGATRSAMRARFRLPIDQRVGLFLGSLQAYRGFDALVAGLDRLHDPVAIPGTIAVAGPDASAVPVHHRLRALGRVEDVSALLQAVDFVVNVNRFSLFDLSIIEAFEAGRPVLLHDSGGNRAFSTLGGGCMPLADLSPATVAAGLERCFTMPDAELAALGSRSRACYDAHLTPDRFARHHVALYDRAERGLRARATA